MNARKVQRASGIGRGGREHAGEAGQVPVCGKFSATPHQGEPGSRWPLFGGCSLLCMRILQVTATFSFLFFFFNSFKIKINKKLLKSSFMRTPKRRVKMTTS